MVKMKKRASPMLALTMAVTVLPYNAMAQETAENMTLKTFNATMKVITVDFNNVTTAISAEGLEDKIAITEHKADGSEVAVTDFTVDITAAMSDKWNKRYRDNMDKMKSGDIYEVADVVRNLSFKQKEKGLSTGEKKMLSNAKQILVSELVLAEQASQDEIENLVNNKIELSFEENKLPQEEVDLNKNVVSKFIPFDDSSTNV